MARHFWQAVTCSSCRRRRERMPPPPPRAAASAARRTLRFAPQPQPCGARECAKLRESCVTARRSHCRSGAMPRAARRQPRTATLPPLPVRCVPRPPCGSRRRAALRSLRLATYCRTALLPPPLQPPPPLLYRAVLQSSARYPHVLSTAQFCSPSSTGGGG